MDTLIGHDPGSERRDRRRDRDDEDHRHRGDDLLGRAEVYKDANEAATITVVDPDENLNCNQVEYVPVFVIVNPGSWNPVGTAADDGTEQTARQPEQLLHAQAHRRRRR